MDEETKARLAKLADLPDSEIDTSDIKEWSDEDFSRAVPFHKVFKPRKEQITTRIDADVLLWLKSHGKGYQTFLNDLLRKEMIEESKQLA
ncbi:MAG: BrnA antitoxin family protein [Spirochaetales bacterium]|nr:BrnA antitoxin family protein [Spirochaetales bacterium]